ISFLVFAFVLFAMVFLVAPVAADKYIVTSNSYAPVAGNDVIITAQLSFDNSTANATVGNVVTWSKTGTGGSFLALTSITNEAGIATVNFTTGTVAGTAYTITGTDEGSSTGTSTAITTVAGAATQIAVNAGNNQSAPVNTAVTIPPSVIVKDMNNNPVSGAPVNFAVPTGSGLISGTSATTGSNGIAAVGSWVLGPTAGTHTLTATSGSLTTSFTANATTATTMTPTPTPTPALNSTANGSIYVQSTPTSSKVFLNNVYHGYTPMTLYNITPGTPLLTVRRADYNDWSQNVAVTAGNTTSIIASLVLTPEVTTATVTTPKTTVTTVKTTAKSTSKVPTPWPSDTPTPASPVGVLVILGAVGVGLIVIRKL
ncbi:MAG: PEGA domain-containing protein, partial [Methanoregula sp.]|nr:PEGA domain-containing protein [Methanoregula sp.]